jgi:hypothetical protein
MLTITNMATVGNSEVICDELNVVGICTGGTYVYSDIIKYVIVNLRV